VVITTAVSYTLHEWERFAVPLRRVYDGDVFVLVEEREKEVWEQAAAKYRLKTVLLALREKPPKGGEAQASEKTLLHANAVKKARYEQYNRICASYDWCFATDFRDVFFQADPFARLPTGFDLALSEEWAGYSLGKCQVNSEWLLGCFPHEFFNRVKKRPIICSGTILGTPAGFVALSEAMLAAYRSTQGKRGCFARDQGHLIYVVYSGALEKLLPGRVLLQVRLVRSVDLSFHTFSTRSRAREWPCRWRC
jgi:hypothetical protein